MKKILAVCLVGIMLIGMLEGCNTGKKNANSGTLTASLSAKPSKLDPIHYSGTYEAQIIRQVCDTVVEYNDGLDEFIPYLATSWKISEDGLNYVLKIRENVHFQNTKYAKGREMTAEDVAYSLNRSAQFSDHNRLATLAKAEVTGDWEVTCTLKSRDAAFLVSLANPGNVIVAKEEVEGWGDDFGYHLSGTGPFYLDKFELDEQAVFSANKDYWLGTPNLEKLVFKFITEPKQVASALQTGVIDLGTDLTGEAINIVNNDSELKLLKQEKLQVNYIRFNAKRGPTANPIVRKALIQSVDFEAVRKALYRYDEARAAYLPLPYNSWGYDASLESLFPAFDVQAAKKLMADAGYQDGFEITINVSNKEALRTLATMLQGYWAEIGVNAKISINEWGTFSDIVCSGNSDVYAMSWSWGADPYFYLNKLFHSSEISATGNGAGYVNEEVDELLDKAVQTSDQNERATYYHEVIKQVMSDYAGAFYANPYDLYGINERVQDFVPRANGTLRFITANADGSVARNVSVTD